MELSHQSVALERFSNGWQKLELAKGESFCCNMKIHSIIMTSYILKRCNIVVFFYLPFKNFYLLHAFWKYEKLSRKLLINYEIKPSVNSPHIENTF